MGLSAQTIRQFHVFLASPGDVSEERQIVRQFFDRCNRQIGQLWSVRFEVVDWENYASIGVGRPQELITKQTLERFKDSLAVVIGIMAQRFGTPTGKAESGTEEEFRWALEYRRQTGYPEIKWFFRRVDQFIAPPEPDAVAEALHQWKKVRAFQDELKRQGFLFASYSDISGFREVFENDLNRWLTDRSKPWIPASIPDEHSQVTGITVPMGYYQSIERHFHRLDIAGIDNDRAFEIPLSDIYVRLRVMLDEDLLSEADNGRHSGTFDENQEVLRYPKLV